MKKNFFRKESMSQITSPDQLKDYIRVVNPSVWMILLSIVILLCGVCIWGFWGQLDTTVTTVCITNNDETICYIKESDIDKVEQGMKVIVEGKESTIDVISKDLLYVDSDFLNSLGEESDLFMNEGFYCAILEDVCGEDGSISSAEIVVETIVPAFFVIN